MTQTGNRRGASRTEAIMRTTLELGQEIGYAKLSIEAVAARAESRQRHVHGVALGEDLDPPLGRVADHLAPARLDDDRRAHASSLAAAGPGAGAPARSIS